MRMLKASNDVMHSQALTFTRIRSFTISLTYIAGIIVIPSHTEGVADVLIPTIG